MTPELNRQLNGFEDSNQDTANGNGFQQKYAYSGDSNECTFKRFKPFHRFYQT
jgi:hypothetical protein